MYRGEGKPCGVGSKEPPSLRGVPLVEMSKLRAASASEGLRAMKGPQEEHDRFCTSKFPDPLIVILSK